MKACEAYEVIKAKTAEEALEKSKYRIGGLCVVCEIKITPNDDGTWSVFPRIKPLPQDNL